MPVIESHLLAFYLLLATGGLTPLLMGPGRQDAFTIAGAMAGVLLVVLDLHGRPRGHRKVIKGAFVILAGMVCGALLPGFVLKTWLSHWIPLLDWEAYAVFGFVGAVAGQRIVRWLIEFFDNRFPSFLDRGAEWLLGIKPVNRDEAKGRED